MYGSTVLFVQTSIWWMQTDIKLIVMNDEVKKRTICLIRQPGKKITFYHLMTKKHALFRAFKKTFFLVKEED